MRSVKTILALLTGAMLLAGLAAATAAPAQAAATHSCRGSSCSGKDPHATGCDTDARTVGRVRPAGGGPLIQLRYSRKCRAAWSRMRDHSEGWLFKLEVKHGPTYTGAGSQFYS